MPVSLQKKVACVASFSEWGKSSKKKTCVQIEKAYSIPAIPQL